MWGRRRRWAGPGGGGGLEELRARRREREAALRKARRQEQLVSKRLLREDTAEQGLRRVFPLGASPRCPFPSQPHGQRGAAVAGGLPRPGLALPRDGF
uniref:Uncharacterized protein n=1 Tax=Calidris pygmaea TaxID=425635 RepID=A0A8C3PKR8_9CHAR